MRQRSGFAIIICLHAAPPERRNTLIPLLKAAASDGTEFRRSDLRERFRAGPLAQSARRPGADRRSRRRHARYRQFSDRVHALDVFGEFQGIVRAFCLRRFVAARSAPRRMLATRHLGFQTDNDLFAPDELERDETLNFMRRHGLGDGAGMAAPLPTGDLLCLGVARSYDHGPMEKMFVERLDQLRPHLTRSAFISARLQLERAQAAAEMLTVLGLPAVLLSRNGAAVAANNLIEALSDVVQWHARDRVALADPNADTILRTAIAALDAESSRTPLSFALRGNEARAAMVAHLVPIRGSARDVFSHCAGVLVLTPATAAQAPPIELIQSLFDLTPAEARVARGLAAGYTLDDIAAANGVSRNTIRSQLRGALEKTGSAGRQNWSPSLAVSCHGSLTRNRSKIPTHPTELELLHPFGRSAKIPSQYRALAVGGHTL